jgi:hypothetical protein
MYVVPGVVPSTSATYTGEYTLDSKEPDAGTDCQLVAPGNKEDAVPFPYNALGTGTAAPPGPVRSSDIL